MNSPLTSKEKRVIRRVKNPNGIEVNTEIPEVFHEETTEEFSHHDEVYTVSNVFDESINELVNMSKGYANRLVEIEAYSDTVEQLKQQKIAIESELRLKENMIQESKDEMKRMESQRDDVVKQFKKKQFANKIDFLSKNKLNSLISETEKLNDVITVLNGKNSKLDYELMNLRHKIDDLTLELDLAKGESIKLEEVISNDQNNLISMKNDIVDLNKTINDENKDISLKKVEDKKLSLEIDILTSEIEKLKRQQADTMRKHESVFSKEMEAATRKYRDLKAKYDKLVEERVGIVNSVNKKKEILFNKRNLKSGIATLVDKDKEKMMDDREALDKKQREILQKEADIRDLK